MTREGMFEAEDIVALLRRQPFQPFRIHMSDGSVHEVSHPELAMVSPRRVIVAVPHEREGMIQDYSSCALLHVTQLEELADSA